jgi:hypothetical protein
MSGIAMRISKYALILCGSTLLAACNKSDEQSAATSEQEEESAEANDGKIECALAGSDKFARTCDTERIAGPAGQILVIRHPDGGFRRFKVLTDGRGLAAAEGADKTGIKILNNGTIELASGDDLYRLPAQIKSDIPPQTPPQTLSPAEVAEAPAETSGETPQDK